MTVEILRIHEELNVTKTMFTLTEWLASPGATNFNTDIGNVKERTKCLFGVFYMSARKDDGTYCENPSIGPPLIISIACRRTTNRFPRSLTRQINY